MDAIFFNHDFSWKNKKYRRGIFPKHTPTQMWHQFPSGAVTKSSYQKITRNMHKYSLSEWLFKLHMINNHVYNRWLPWQQMQKGSCWNIGLTASTTRSDMNNYRITIQSHAMKMNFFKKSFCIHNTIHLVPLQKNNP